MPSAAAELVVTTRPNPHSIAAWAVAASVAGAFAYYRSRHDNAVIMSRAEIVALNEEKKKVFEAKRVREAAEVEPPPPSQQQR